MNINNNDINYFSGLVIAIYVTYVNHYNIKPMKKLNKQESTVLSLILLSSIVFIANKNLTLGVILSIGYIVTVN